VQPRRRRPIVDGLSPGAEFGSREWAEAQPRGALESYLRAIRAHRLLVVVVVLATLFASIVWMTQRTPEYKATARLLITPLPQTDEFLGLPVMRDSGDPTRTMQTAATLLELPEAAQATADKLGGGWSAQKVLDAVDLEPEGESNILAVTARAEGKEAAIELANTFTDAALAERNAALSRAADPIIARLNETRARLGASDPSAADIEDRIVTLEALSAAGDPSTKLSRRAGPSASVAGAPPFLIVLLALLAGVVLGSVAALLMEMLGPQVIRDEADLDEVDAAPVLARVPSRSHRDRRRRRSALAAPPSALASFRGLEFQLGEGHRAVLFTGAGPEDGTTTCVVDFALELSSAGHRVVLLDLDLRKPELSSRLGVAGDDANSSRALVPVPGMLEIEVLPGVADATRATLETLGQRLPEVIAEARSRDAYVLVDTSPLGDAEDALRFAPAVDDVVLVARLGHTSRADVEIARDLLDRIRKPPAGVIVIGGRDRRRAGKRRRAGNLGVAPGGGSSAQPAREPPGESLGDSAQPAREPPGESLGDSAQPAPETPSESLGDLVAAGLLPDDAKLVARTNRREHFARLNRGKVTLNGTQYASLSAAAASITGRRTDGWSFWQTWVDGEYVPLSVLRSRLPRA
jgi:tyrosine-protein kinase